MDETRLGDEEYTAARAILNTRYKSDTEIEPIGWIC